MRLISISLFILLGLFGMRTHAQTFTITGKVSSEIASESLADIHVSLKHTSYHTTTDAQGNYTLSGVKPGKYTLVISSLGHKKNEKEIVISNGDIVVDVALKGHVLSADSVVVVGEKEKTFGVTRLKDVEGTAIYAGKKTEVVVMNDITVNTATNNSRQIYSKIAGLNIWENDGAGIQLGIGGRGLSPNRTANFNTRQNGYDMSADALGYPESYYSPATEAVDRIEIVRGAASLQYGTQFGGMVNFKLKKGPANKKIETTARQTVGSWGFYNAFTSVGGTVKKVNYYGFYQHKAGQGWRPNSQFNSDMAYASAVYTINPRLSVTAQYTFMEYLAHQPGGLTDKEFNTDPSQSIRNRNWFKVNWNLASVSLDYKFNERLKLNTRFFGLMASRSALGILTFIDRPDPMGNRDLWTDHYKNFGNETRLLYHYTIGSSTSTLLVGFRYYNGHTHRTQGLGNTASSGGKSDFQFIGSSNVEYSDYSFPNENESVFLENIFQVTPKLSIIPGIRYENIKTVADGFYNQINYDQSGNILLNEPTNEYRSNHRSFVIGGIGLSYEQSDRVRLYANASQNYRAINFNDMRVVNPNLKVDPNLKDEKGYSADIGIRGSNSIFNYDASLFLIEYDDRIGSVKVDTALYRIRTNISQSRNVGVETFVEVDFWRLLRGESAKSKITVFSNFTYVDAKYINSKEPIYNNKQVELAPNVILKSGLSYKSKRFSATYQFSYTSQQYTDATNSLGTSNAINGLIPAYYIMDLSAEYKVNKTFTVYGTINNLANNMYFTRRADSYPGPGIIPSDARAFYLTAQIKL